MVGAITHLMTYLRTNPRTTSIADESGQGVIVWLLALVGIGVILLVFGLCALGDDT
jgi:hypothetical protein